MGKQLGRLVHKFMKRRRHIAEVNVKLCFPHMSEADQKALVLKNMENTGIAMVETGMAWWWPQWRAQKALGSFKGLEHFERVQASGKGVLLLVPHILHLEMASRIMGLECQGIGFYRPHNNPLMEYFTTNGRLRSNEYLIGRKDVKGLLKALKIKRYVITYRIKTTAVTAVSLSHFTQYLTRQLQQVLLCLQAVKTVKQ